MIIKIGNIGKGPKLKERVITDYNCTSQIYKYFQNSFLYTLIK